MKKLNKSQERVLWLLENSPTKKIEFDCAEKGKARDQNAALQLAEIMPKKIKATWKDYRYFKVEIIA